MSLKWNGENLICHISIFVSIHFQFIQVWFEIWFYIFSLYHSGHWQWCITHSFYLWTFVCEIFNLNIKSGLLRGFDIKGELLDGLGEDPQKSQGIIINYFTSFTYVYTLHLWMDKFLSCWVNPINVARNIFQKLNTWAFIINLIVNAPVFNVLFFHSNTQLLFSAWVSWGFLIYLSCKCPSTWSLFRFK